MGVINDDQFERTDEWAHGAHLFDPAPFDTPKVERDPATMHPGDLTHEEWMQRPDVTFHGTFRHKDFNSPLGPGTIHSGTLQSAQERMQTIHRLMGLTGSSLRERKPAIGETSTIGGERNYREIDETYAARYAGLEDDPQGYLWDKDDPVFDENGRVDSRKARAHVVNRELTHGVIVGRRIDQTFPARVGDAHANVADRDYLEEMGEEASSNVRGSIGDHDESFSLALMRGMDPSTEEYERLHPVFGLGRGLPVGYKNISEHPGSISYVIPKGGSTGYWDDFLASPNRSEEEKAHVRRMQAELGSHPVPFIIRAAKDTGVQGKLFKDYPFMDGNRVHHISTAEPNFDQPHEAGFVEKTVTHVARPVLGPTETGRKERAKVGRGGVKKEPPIKGKFGDDGGLPEYLGI